MPEQSSPDPVKSLVTRLAEACNAVGGIEKKGTNQKQNYKYIRAADVAKAFRRELFNRNIALVPDEKEFTQIGAIKTQSGGEMREFLLRMDYHICDGFSGERITVGAFGVAMDTGDKAIWKAKTGALKYFLRTLGIIPDEKDDPEADEEVDKLLDPKTEPSPELLAKMEKQRRISQLQVAQVWAAMKRNGKTPEELRVKLEAKKLTQLEEVTQEMFPLVMNWANGGGSVKAIKESGGHPVEMSRIFSTASDRGIPESDVKRYAYETHKVDSMTKLGKPQLQEVLEWVQGA